MCIYRKQPSSGAANPFAPRSILMYCANSAFRPTSCAKEAHSGYPPNWVTVVSVKATSTSSGRTGVQRIVATVKALRRKPKGGRPRSYQGIADILNANAIPPRAGAKWHASSVRNVCRGAAYRAARVGDALAISLGD